MDIGQSTCDASESAPEPSVATGSLPTTESIDLVLSHPTPAECVQIWRNTATAWRDSLTLSQYLAESQYLTTVPLARLGGMATWVLVDKNLAPDHRQLLCSCETFRKRALESDAAGNVQDVIIHGIASVFCPPNFRNRGYAARLMTELAKVLHQWQADVGRPIGSVLYSDIGKKYYAKLGWTPNRTNFHIELPPTDAEWPAEAAVVSEEDLDELCQGDEIIVRAAMSEPRPDVKRRVAILPDLDHMLWNIRKEDFAMQYLFGRIPHAKGAMAGSPGRQVWAIWTHRYYDRIDAADSGNVLYILRLVVDGDETANKPRTDNLAATQRAMDGEQLESLKSVIRASQAEAAKWRLDQIHLWEPSPLVLSTIQQAGVSFKGVERETKSVASGYWYGDSATPVWINNERYAWC